MKPLIFYALTTLVLASVCRSNQDEPLKFSFVISKIAEMRDEALSDHRFLKMLADSSLSEEKRMSFMPYLTYFAMSFPDVLNSWIGFENPQNEIEERINTAIEEDNFHYNFFLRDMERVSKIDRYGSYSAVMRHLWGDESKSVRQLIYAWILYAKKYNDPLVTLASFEVLESIYTITYKEILNGGIDGYEYFGDYHGELEMGHSQTKWMAEEEVSPLDNLDVSTVQMEQILEVVTHLLEKFHSAYDALYNLAMAEDSIRPEKYIVEGNPPLHKFPESHPNKVPPAKQGRKTEL